MQWQRSDSADKVTTMERESVNVIFGYFYCFAGTVVWCCPKMSLLPGVVMWVGDQMMKKTQYKRTQERRDTKALG